MSNLLSVENLTMKFGGLTAIDDLSFDAKNNQITSIIGPNGAGKTTVFNCLTGFYKPTNGQMFLHKEDSKISLRKYTDFKIAYVAKVARTFQNIELFENMTVIDNILFGAHRQLNYGAVSSLFYTKKVRNSEREAREIAEDIIEEKPPENGCSFQGRCPRILGDICKNEVPPWQTGENGNSIRCHIKIEDLKNQQISN